MQNWEYLVKRDLDDRDLNLYGLDGWELVAVIRLQSLINQTTGRQESEIVHYFKRPIIEEKKPGKGYSF